MAHDGLNEPGAPAWPRAAAIGLSLGLHVALGTAALLLARPARLGFVEPAAIEVAFASPAAAWPLPAPALTPTPESATAEPAPILDEVPAEPLAPPTPDAAALSPSPPTEPVPPESIAALPPDPARIATADPVPSVAPPPHPPSPRPAERPMQAKPSPAVRPAVTTAAAGLPIAPNATEPARAAPVPAPTGPALIDAGWRGALTAWVRSRTRYPEEARRLGREGGATVRFTVARDGQMLDAALVQGSGSDLLDEAALAIFRGARGPGFPPDMAQAQLTITTTIRFHLER